MINIIGSPDDKIKVLKLEFEIVGLVVRRWLAIANLLDLLYFMCDFGSLNLVFTFIFVCPMDYFSQLLRSIWYPTDLLIFLRYSRIRILCLVYI